MLWPVLGGGYIGSPFGAPRDGGARSHMGNDLMADKLQPVVAVADGVVFRAATDSGISGTIVGVRHDDGWSSYYIHLNNDRYNTDDGRGVGIRPGIEVGTRVEAGELIGWNGDSGNAEGTVPHVHFELHTPSGQAIDPEASLRAALRKAEWPNLPRGAKSFDGAYWDDDGSPVESLVDTLVANHGTVLGCGKGGFTLCAQAEVTSDDLRGLLKRLNPPIGTVLADLDQSTLFQSASTESAAGLSASIGSIQVPEVVTEADIARVAAAESDFDRTRIASLYATTNSTKTALASPPRGVETYAAGEALDILQRDGVLGECIESLDDTKPVNRADAISLIAQTSNQLPGPCGGPSDDGGAIIPPGPAVERWRPLVEEYFPKKRVEEAMRVLACESRGNPNAVNPTSDATGLFQFIPTTWMWASAAAGYGGYDRTHPEANVASAAWLTSRDEARGVDAWSAWECKP
ncbi:MAG: peptidoglycan DD-metalloendopeptidase family protein [Acidimicrobiia bacterium]|nr:peptidoglycan DD-metalloendopeptidase family protein [Acidimicrobiia bacterium]